MEGLLRIRASEEALHFRVDALGVFTCPSVSSGEGEGCRCRLAGVVSPAAPDECHSRLSTICSSSFTVLSCPIIRSLQRPSCNGIPRVVLAGADPQAGWYVLNV